MNIETLEKNTWADRSKAYNSIFETSSVGSRVELFKLLDVPKNVIEQFLFTKQFEEVNEQMRTFESLRSFNSLPKWVKNRMKYRLKHMSDFLDFEHFVINL